MSRVVPEEHLVTLPEWHQEIGFQLKTVNRWAERRKVTKFPEPNMRLGRTRFFDRRELDKWLRLWKRAHPNIIEGSES